MTAGWHELTYVTKAITDVLNQILERTTYLRSWLEDEEGEEADAESHRVFPAVAWDSLSATAAALQQAEILTAQEWDRRESAASTEPLETARARVVALQERVASLEEALKYLEEATNWIDSFRKVGSSGDEFADYSRDVAKHLTRLVESAQSALRSAAETLQSLSALHRTSQERDERQRELKQREDEQAAKEREASARAERDRQSVEEARKKAAKERTARQLRDIVEGQWVVTATNSWGQRSIQEIHLSRHLLGHCEYQATGAAWSAVGKWDVLNGSQIRFSGFASALGGGPIMSPFMDVVTFEVLDDTTLRSVSAAGIRMEWQRNEYR